MQVFDTALYLWVATCAALLIGMSKGGLPVVGMLGVPILSLVLSPIHSAALLLPLFIASDAFGV